MNTRQRSQAGQRIRRFTLTLNNYSAEEYNLFRYELDACCSWAVLGKEVGSEGTPHLQGAGVLKKQMSFNTLRAHFPRAHLEPMKGTPHQNYAYCTKEDKDAYTVGDLPQPGKRTDLHNVADLIDEGATLKEVAEVYPTAIVKYSRGLTVLRSIKCGKRDPRNPPKVLWLFGSTGTGKTRYAWDYGCSHYGEDSTIIMPDSTLKWFDGYDGQKCVILDDFRAKGVCFSFFLRVLDRYPLQGPIKGGFVNWNPEVIIITTPHDVETTFSKRNEHIPEDIEQLRRRITQCMEFPLGGGSVGSGNAPRLVRQDASLTQCIACCEPTENINEKGLCNSCL